MLGSFWFIWTDGLSGGLGIAPQGAARLACYEVVFKGADASPVSVLGSCIKLM